MLELTILLHHLEVKGVSLWVITLSWLCYDLTVIPFTVISAMTINWVRILPLTQPSHYPQGIVRVLVCTKCLLFGLALYHGHYGMTYCNYIGHISMSM